MSSDGSIDRLASRPGSRRADTVLNLWAKARFTNPLRLVAAVCVAGLLVTVGVSWTAWTLDRNNEHRLLQVQTKQAAALLTSTISSIEDPLHTALAIDAATGGDPQQFTQFMATYIGANGLFSSASLWRVTGDTTAAVASVGASPALASSSPDAKAFISRALHSTTFVVTSISSGAQQSIGYALADPKDPRFAVYAERAIPANRRVPVESNSAFSELHFATYLGATTSSSTLATTDVAPGDLPLSGTTARETIPFGDTVLTLVTSPAGQLGGDLGAQLPWIFLGGGLVLTLAATLIAGQLVRRRTAAETDAHTIAGLYDQLDTLYGQQRTIAETLQHALLPERNPSVANLEIATRYVAGARGVDIGGDWYSVIQIDDDHMGFVVGDVSGRGVDAAAIMARIRFTLHAYLVNGDSPDMALSLCSRQLNISVNGHMATAIVGIANLRTRDITLANAGHLNPLVVNGGQVQFVATAVGPPLGVGVNSYAATTLTMPRGSMFLAFTDGLVERRTEDLDVGLHRLADIAASTVRPLESLVSTVLATMTGDGSEDDIAILAFEWTSQASTTESHLKPPGTTTHASVGST